MIGRIFLKRFRVDRLLCEGGMGQIYIARQADQDREVVVKVLKQRAVHATIRERFRREIQALAQFQHPYVVEYYGGCTEPDNMFLVMEYIRGTALDMLLALAGRFTPDRVGRLLVQLCDVLQAVHDQGIVHCDLKPSNVMVVHPGTALESIKLMDFGVAKMPTELSLSALEMDSGQFLSGTPQYMSPEQARAEEPDHRADLYSLGVVLYELLTGRLPFESSSPTALLEAHQEQAPPPFVERCAAAVVPRPIEQVVQSLLSKHREQRPQSAAELARLYEKALGRKIVVPPKRGTLAASSLSPRASNGHATATPAAKPETPAPAAPTAPAAPVAGAAPPPSAAAPVIDPNAAVHELHVRMPQTMAMLKLRGFVKDLGGRIVEGEAASSGVVRVRLPALQAAQSPSAAGLSSWFGGGGDTNVRLAPGGEAIDMELRIQRDDPKEPNQLTVTLTLRSKNSWSVSRKEQRARYEKIYRDLKAYLQATS